MSAERGINVFSLTEHSEGESLFYIISPKDIVVAKERDQDDHIDWLLEKKKYEVSAVGFYEFCKRLQSVIIYLIVCHVTVV